MTETVRNSLRERAVAFADVVKINNYLVDVRKPPQLKVVGARYQFR